MLALMDRASNLVTGAQIAEQLRQLGLKPTGQRVRIAGMLIGTPVHLTAEQILASLRAAGEKISRATVYNTLHALARTGLIRQINIDPQRCVYDSTRAPHHHFHDLDTGELMDIQPGDIEFSRFPALPEGMEADAVEVVIRIRRKAAQRPQGN